MRSVLLSDRNNNCQKTADNQLQLGVVVFVIYVLFIEKN